MAELQLGGKTIATQTGTAEPVIASNVTGTLGSGVDISNVTGTLSNNVFPAGHIIQQTTGSFTYTGDAGTASATRLARQRARVGECHSPRHRHGQGRGDPPR